MSGFIALSYEILWYRAFAFVSWGSPTVFGLLLGAFLLGVALGALFSRFFCRDGQVDPSSDGRRLRAIGAFVFLADAAAFLVIPILGWCSLDGWPRALAAVTVAAGLLGAVFPLVAHFGITPDDRAGQNISYVYLANILGSASGSIFTGFVLMDVWSTRVISIFLALVGLSIVALLVIASRWTPGDTRKAFLVVGLCALAFIGGSHPLFDDLYERLLYKDKFPWRSKLIHVIENRHGVIVVNRFGQVYGGGAYDGAFNTSLVDDRNVIERAFAVGAIHPHPRNVLMIGLSSGSWAQVIAHLPEVERVTVVEINPGYLDLIAQYPAVSSLLTNPKVHIEIDDGRRWLVRHPDAKFDVIVMNTTWHWRAHITNLLSREFLALARSHLSPGGVHYFNTTSSDDAQLTASLAFPYSLRIANFIAVSDSPIVFDNARWEAILRGVTIDGTPALDLSGAPEQEAFARLMQFPDLAHEGPYQFWSLETRDRILARTAGATIITDDNMACEWKSPLSFPVRFVE